MKWIPKRNGRLNSEDGRWMVKIKRDCLYLTDLRYKRKKGEFNTIDSIEEYIDSHIISETIV